MLNLNPEQANNLINSMKRYVYIRTTDDDNIFYIGKTSQDDPLKRAAINGSTPLKIVAVYDNAECINYLKFIFKFEFNLVKGNGYFSGDKDEMIKIFLEETKKIDKLIFKKIIKNPVAHNNSKAKIIDNFANNSIEEIDNNS